MTYIRRSPIWPDPRVKPPFGAARINWEHPMARDLAAYYLLNERAGTTAVDGATSKYTGGVVGTTVSWDLAGATFGGSGYFYVARAARAAFPVSIAMRGSVTNTATVQYFMTQGQQVAAGGICGLAQVAGVGYYVVKAVAADAAAQPTSGTLSANAPVTLGGTSITNTTHIAYNNGVAGSTVISAAFPSPLWTNVSLGILRRDVTTFPLTGGLTWAAIWGRVVTQQEHAWLHAEPYAMLEPVIRRRYFPQLQGLVGELREWRRRQHFHRSGGA